MSETINIRVTEAEKEVLRKVAAGAGYTLSGFLRVASMKEAYRVLGPPKLVDDNQ